MPSPFAAIVLSLLAVLLAMGTSAASGAEQVSLPVPEGAYRVTLALRGAAGGSDVNVTGESRRALLQHVRVPEGEAATATFNVWRIGTGLPDGGHIRLHAEREVGTATYDDLLTLRVFGERPLLDGLTIEPAGEGVVNVFLAGDSTVTDQTGVPWSSWGAMLPGYFDETVAVANLASSGRALRSFRAERRFGKILSLLRPGDYVFIQFGHNDQKERGEGIGPFESYTDDLIAYVEAVRAAGGRPVLVTPPVRRRFDREGQWYDTLGDYPVAVRRVAADREVPLIDLFEQSRQIVEALGEESSKNLYVHFPAGTFADQPEAWKDDTHFRTYGGDLLARAVIEEMKSAVPDLAARLRDPSTGVDSTQPDPLSAWDWPEPGTPASRVPEGS